MDETGGFTSTDLTCKQGMHKNSNHFCPHCKARWPHGLVACDTFMNFTLFSQQFFISQPLTAQLSLEARAALAEVSRGGDVSTLVVHARRAVLTAVGRGCADACKMFHQKFSEQKRSIASRLLLCSSLGLDKCKGKKQGKMPRHLVFLEDCMVCNLCF